MSRRRRGTFGDDTFGGDEPLWMWLLLLLPRALGQLFSFLIYDWSSSRTGRAFFFALPAMATVALIIAILSIAAWKLETNRERFYSGRLEYYQKQEDWDFARNCAAKLVELKPTAENKYKLALTLKRQADDVGAFELMSVLAPEEKAARGAKPQVIAKPQSAAGEKSAGPDAPDSAGNRPNAAVEDQDVLAEPSSDGSDSEDGLFYVGFVPAHLWLADRAAFDPESGLSVEERKRLARLHYSAALELSAQENTPESIYAALRLAELQVQDGDLAGAERTLREAANKPITTLLHLKVIGGLLAVLNKQDGLDEIKSIAASLQPRLYKLASQMPEVLEPWQSLMEVAIQAENYIEADQFLLNGLAIAKEPATRRGLFQLRAAVLTRRALLMQDVEREDRYLEKFGYLAMAMSVDPTNEMIYVAMLQYADLNDQNPDEEDFLRSTLGTGKSPGIAHVILGIRDAQRKEKLSAFNHWEIAETHLESTEWHVGMFARKLLQAKSLDSEEFFRFLEICQERYPNQPLLSLARAEALLLLRQDATAAVPLLEKLIAENQTFTAAREAYITALKALGRNEDADREVLKLKEMIAEAQKRQAETAVGKGKN